ncbi:MAG: alpha/beta fold hydrolase [Deltaproteobacteria bacterium]
MFAFLLCLLVWATLLFQAATYLLWGYENREQRRRGGGRQTLPAVVSWFGEWLALLLALLAWPVGLLPARRPTAAGDGSRPVVLIHGWGMNRASMALLAARLRRDGRQTHALNYSTLRAGNEDRARQVAADLLRVCEQSGGGLVDVVAHSLGGIVVRAAARNHGILAHLGNVVTLGSPHQGTALAEIFPLATLRELRTDSPYLYRLGQEDTLAATVNVTSIRSDFDAGILPSDKAEYPGALNITIDYVGHMSLLASRRVYQLVQENLDAPPRQQ